jgi:hypothetical protein
VIAPRCPPDDALIGFDRFEEYVETGDTALAGEAVRLVAQGTADSPLRQLPRGRGGGLHHEPYRLPHHRGVPGA